MQLFHPSVAPFVVEAARAFLESGTLEKFQTTIERRKLAQALVPARFPASWFERLRNREANGIPLEKIECFPTGEILRLVAGRIDRSGRLTDHVWEWAEKAFDRRVADSLTPETRGVYGYEHACLETFRRAGKLGIPRVYDVPAPETGYARRLLEEEIRHFPELDTAYWRQTCRLESRRHERRQSEWELGDRVIVASRFTRRTFEAAGCAVGKVRVVPYGCPPVVEKVLQPPPTGPLRLIWAGTFSVRKGAHYLLEAWRRGDLGKIARLDVYGSIALPERAMTPLPPGIHLQGTRSRQEVLDALAPSEALLFPTLCDGYGMVVAEAWSRGVPVLTTERAGAAERLEEGKNGRLFVAGDIESLLETIRWAARNREALHAMRPAARATAAAWQWADYRAALRRETLGGSAA